MEHTTISITLDETTYAASCELKRGIVMVRSDIGTRSASLDNSLPDIIARMLPPGDRSEREAAPRGDHLERL